MLERYWDCRMISRGNNTPQDIGLGYAQLIDDWSTIDRLGYALMQVGGTKKETEMEKEIEPR